MSPSWMPAWMKSGESTKDAPREASNGEVQQIEAMASSSGEQPMSGQLSIPITKEGILEALKEVYDPELAISIIDLGLVYDVEIRGKEVRVTMTLTSPGCPLGPTIIAMINSAVAQAYSGVEKVHVDFVWTPPWDPYKMATEEGKDMLGIW